MTHHRKFASVFFIVILLFAAAIPASGLGDAKLVLKNIPTDVSLHINGLTRQPDDSGGFPVAPGPVLLEIKQKRVVVYSAMFTVDSSEVKTIVFDCTADCALLHVVTDPPGATLSMNGTILGVTPYMNRFVKPGAYSIMATYPGRIPIVRRIDLSLDSSTLFNLTMEQTQAVKDSITAVKRAQRVKRQIIQSISFGGLGIGLAVAGVWFDHEALRHLDNARAASESYNMARTADQCGQLKATYQQERELARQPIRYRNIFYGAAGVCLAGLYLSFVF